MENRRWCVSKAELATCIEFLQKTPPYERDRLVYGMMRLIHRYGPDLLDTFVMEFPLDVHKSKWYDHDPNLWLAINGLLYGGEKLQKIIILYLEREMLTSTMEACYPARRFNIA